MLRQSATMTSIGSAAMTAAVDGDEAPQPFTIFHSFPKLPKEIRLMIWELQLPGPRIVHLELKQFKVAKSSWLLEYEMLYGRRYYSGGMEHDYKDYTWPNYPPEFGRGGKKIERWKQSCQWISSHRAPTILFVNRESHHVGKTVYTQTFETIGSRPSVWFSYKQDTLYLSRSVVENLLHSDLKQDEFGLEFSNVKKLLLGQPISDWLQHSGTKYERICEVIGWFGKLEHLALVSDDPAGVPVNSNFIVPKYECFDALLGFYKGGYTRERDVELQSFLTSITDQSRRRNEVETAGITAKREQWIQKREKLIRARIHVTSQIWQVPEVYRQLITTAERQAEYDQALEKYNKQKADYRMRVIMTTWGRENFLFSASQTSTVENMAEAFRAERRYSKKRDIKIRRAGQILKPETRIFDVANIERVDFFTATVR